MRNQGTSFARDAARLAALLGALLAPAGPAWGPSGAGAPVPSRAGAGEPEGQAEDPHRHDATAGHPFDDVDKWVRVFDDPARDEWQKPEQAVQALGIEKGQRVAEIGAGTGYFSRHLARAVGEEGTVYAIDTEPKMVEHLARRAEREGTPQVIAVLGAPDDPRIPDPGVDLVLMVDTYHHIDDRVGYLRRLAGRLRRGGRVAVIDFEKRALPVGPPPEHKLARGQVGEEFAEAGYALLQEPGFLPHQYFLIFAPVSRQGAVARENALRTCGVAAAQSANAVRGGHPGAREAAHGPRAVLAPPGCAGAKPSGRPAG